MKKTSSLLCLLLAAVFCSGQQTINGSIMHDGLQRDYVLYVPATYNPGTPTPLIFNFHGYTSTANEQMWYGDFRSIADTAGFLVVHPMGTEDALGNTHWNVGWGGSTVDDVGFTEALIDSLALSYTINYERVFSTGMSNGGFMSYLLACELSQRIAAIASVTGSMNLGQFGNCNPGHPMPVMEIHGTADLTVPYNGANWIESIEDILSYWADFNNCDPDPVVTSLPDIDPNDGSTVAHYLFANGDNGVEVEHFKIIGGGHTWPGSIFGGGGTNYDIDASIEIWRFFSQYDINGKINPTNVEPIEDPDFSLSIYPNPCASFVTIETNFSLPVDYQLSTLTGQSIFEGTLISAPFKLDLGLLPRGMYILSAGGTHVKVVKKE